MDTESAAPPTVTVKTFPDALSRGRELLEALESQLLPLRLIEEQLEKEPNNETVKQQQKKLIDEMDAQRQEAIDVLSTAPRLVDEETTIDDVNQSRFYLAYALLTAERYRESAVVANFLCRKYPTNALAPQAGGLAVRAYQGLLAAAQKEPPPAIVSALDELARYMVERWPEDAASKTASEILVRVSLNQGRWRDADQYLEKIPAGSEERFTLQQLIGQLQWNEYLKLTEAKDTAGAAVLLDQAIVSLSKGLEKLPKEQVKGNTLLSGLLLAKAKLRKDQPKEALAVLENANYGPLVRLEGDNPVAPSDANLPSEVYRTTLQVLVSLATAQGGESNMLDRAAAIIEKLRKAVEGQPNAEQKLVGIYYSLAKDIRQQLDDAQPARRGQLVDAFNLLLEKLIPLTNDNSTLRWIGQTFSELGQTLQPNLEAPAKGQSEKLYKNAVDAFAKALANQPGDSETQLRFEQAKVLRHLGRYKESIDEFEKVLLAKNMMVDAQIEAALTFQIWAASDTYKLYDAAMLGGRKNNKNGRNTIWGWGKISQTTNGRKELEAQFFEARYRLAECRFLSGKSHPDAARGKLLVEQSLKDIVSVIVAFPEVGGPAIKARFDALAKKIQTQLGQPPAGLSALSEAPPSS